MSSHSLVVSSGLKGQILCLHVTNTFSLATGLTALLANSLDWSISDVPFPPAKYVTCSALDTCISAIPELDKCP